jgi:hypothetical protein
LERYNDQRVELESAKARANVSVRNEVLSYLTFSVGAAGLGFAPSLVAASATEATGIIILALCSLLMIGGIALRVWK